MMRTAPQIDTNHPWPGLESYDEDSHPWFKGREQESEALLRLAQRETLSVLYGRSGLGKTSLLRAGLFPRLRAADILPIRLHLVLADDAPSLQRQVITAIERECARHSVEIASTDDDGLWAWFNRRDCEFWTADDRLLTPLLVFDQFEEIFTLGRENPQRRMRCDALLAELGDLVENRRPAALRERLEQDPEFAARFDVRRPPPKILLSFREDYLADFDVLYDYVRARSSNRLRLLPMRGDTAQTAVLAASPQHVDAEVAARIVRFIDLRSRPLGELVIEPALLSLVCHRLNARRLERSQPQIGAELLSDGSAEAILTRFYGDAFQSLPPALRDFVEDRLLTASGHRDSCALDNALATAGVDASSLQTLIGRRLLRREDRGGQLRLELIHDVLAPVARASRDARRERERLRVLRKRQRLIAGAMVALLGVVTGMGYLTWQTRVALATAELEAQRSQEAEQAARAVKDFLTEDLIGGVNVSLRGDARQITLLDAIRGAADTVGERFAAEPLTEAAVRMALGESLENLAERDAAQLQFDRALALYREALGPDSTEALQAEAAAINSLSDRGERIEAQAQMRALIPRMEAALGPEHPATLRAKNTLAILYWLLNQPAEGVPLAEAILASARRTLGAEHQVTLVAGNNLARLYRQQQRFPEAEALHRESIEARIRAHGPVNQLVFEAQNDLAGLYRAWGRYPEAETSYRELLAGYREVLGPRHSSVAVVLNNLARTLANQGRHTEALPLYTEALQISLSPTGFGADHINTAAFRANQAISELALGRAQVARALLIEALTVMDQALPERHPHRLNALGTLAQAEAALGKQARAAELRAFLDAPD